MFNMWGNIELLIMETDIIFYLTFPTRKTSDIWLGNDKLYKPEWW